MLEVGRAQRSIFLARRLRDRDLQRQTKSGLNLAENYNGVNDSIRFGKRGELASNHRRSKNSGCSACTSCKAVLDQTAQRGPDLKILNGGGYGFG
jgi:TnpA family transposase